MSSIEGGGRGMASVLFCDVVGSTKLYERLGDTVAHQIVDRCLVDIAGQIGAHGGRVVKTIGDELMALFPDAVTACDAAVAIQTRQEIAATASGAKAEAAIKLRIGFHFGCVILSEGDCFGSTVNVASRMASIAKAGQIITTRATVDALPMPQRATARMLAAAHIRGVGEDIAVAEVMWQLSSEHTVISLGGTVAPRPVQAPSAALRLARGERRWSFDRDHAAITLGRSAENDIVVAEERASRRHATIERRRDRWVLIDHSSNGTFVRPVGEQEFSICREELVLRASGTIGLGRSAQFGGDGGIDFVTGAAP